MLRNLNKLRDRRKPLPKNVQEALDKLAQLAEQRPDLRDLAQTQAALLEATFRAAPPVVRFAMNDEQAEAKLGGGVPLLRGENLPLDPRWLREQFVQLCDALINGRGTQAAATTLKQAVKRGTLDPYELALDVLNNDPQRVMERAAQHDLDAGLTATLLRWTLLPVLEPIAKQLAPHHAGSGWKHGYCPTCGAWPLLAEQRGIEQLRMLRCGLCASEWLTERLVCPFCHSRNASDFAYLYEEGNEGTQRAVTCERCHCYYKAIATLVALSTPTLLVTDLQTLHLDLIALERAFMPPA